MFVAELTGARGGACRALSMALPSLDEKPAVLALYTGVKRYPDSVHKSSLFLRFPQVFISHFWLGLGGSFWYSPPDEIHFGIKVWQWLAYRVDLCTMPARYNFSPVIPEPPHFCAGKKQISDEPQVIKGKWREIAWISRRRNCSKWNFLSFLQQLSVSVTRKLGL